MGWEWKKNELMDAYENAIRPITLGRKNYLFCGNHSAVGWMATICSLIGTCKEQNINPRLYLNDVIAKMPYLKSKTENDKEFSSFCRRIGLCRIRKLV